MSNNLDKKNIYVSVLAKEGEENVRASIVIDSIEEGIYISEFLCQKFGIAAVVTVGVTFDISEVIYANKAYDAICAKGNEVG